MAWSAPQCWAPNTVRRSESVHRGNRMATITVAPRRTLNGRQAPARAAVRACARDTRGPRTARPRPAVDRAVPFAARRSLPSVARRECRPASPRVPRARWPPARTVWGEATGMCARACVCLERCV
eukprot:721805-Prymnesium_polylepis.2